MESTRPVGRPVESTPEERDLLARIRNEARKKYDVETNKKHTCRFCKKDFYKHRIGSHIFKKHPDELKKLFEPMGRIQRPTYPYGYPNFKPCFVCKQVWEQDGHAEAHVKKNPECSAENQLKAIYAFLGCEPPKDTLTINHSHPPVEAFQDAKDRKEEIEVLYKQTAQLTNKLTITNSKLNTATLDNEALKAQIEAYKADLKAVRLEKLRVELREEFHKKRLFFESELLKEKLTIMTAYLHECDKNKDYTAQIAETMSMTLQGDELAELEKLRENAKLPAEPTPPPHPTPTPPLVPPAPEPTPPPIPTPPLVPPAPASEPELTVPPMIEKALSIRERKALGVYVAKTTKSPVNEIVIAEDHAKFCKLCGGTDEFYELNACKQCNKTICADNQIRGCYTLDCSKCASPVCYECVKRNGATRMKPKCSSCVD